MPAALRVILARILGSLAGGIAAWLVGKGFTVDQNTIDAFVTVLLFVFGVVYSIVHTIISARINPKDVSSPTAAKRNT
jgi:hypothetical protein